MSKWIDYGQYAILYIRMATQYPEVYESLCAAFEKKVESIGIFWIILRKYGQETICHCIWVMESMWRLTSALTTLV